MPPLRLEVFENHSGGPQSTVVTDLGALEEARLAAFEKGYTAGWEDAGAAHAGDQTRIRADLARNLQTLSFTYHEARSHILMSLEPLLTDALCRLLPEAARSALVPVILETLMPLAREMADAPVRLVVNPSVRGPVEAMLDGTASLPVEIAEEPSLGDGQAWLRLGDQETRIDLDQAVAGITTAIRDFFSLTRKDVNDGYRR